MKRRYWDSCAFIAWLNKEPGRFEILHSLIQEARAGEIEIVTSAYSIAEVHYVKCDGGVKVPLDEQIAAITDLFLNKWIIPVEVTRDVSELARDLLFEFGPNEKLKPADAIHIASAITARNLGRRPLSFDTWDGGIQKIGLQLTRLEVRRGEKVPGIDIKIGPPTGQLTLPQAYPSNEPVPPSSQSHGDVKPKDSPPAPVPPVTPQAAPGPPQPGSSPGAPPPSQSEK